MLFLRSRPCLYNIITLWQKEKKTMAVVFIALFFSVAVFLLLLSFLSGGLQDLQALEKAKRTYTISMWPKSEKAQESLEILDSCISGGFLPNIEENCNFITFCCNIDESNWYAVFPEANELFNSLLEGNELIAGRWFTKDEIENGTAVAIIDELLYPGVDVGEYISVAGNEVKVIGIGFSNILPYQFMLQTSNEDVFFKPDALNVIFESEVPKEDILSLSHVLYTPPQCLYDLNSEEAISFLLLCIGISLVTMFLIICNVSGAFHRLIDKSKPAYSVIRACGGSKMYITFGMLLLPISLSSVSYILGLVFYYTALIPWIVSRNINLPKVSGNMAVAIYVILLIYCLLFLFVSIKRFLKGGRII